MSTIDDRNYRGKPIEPQMKQQWLDALRSGAYVKTEVDLGRAGSKHHCALGVLNDVMGWEQSYEPHLMDLLGGRGVDDVFIVNDAEYEDDFTRVADWIEQNIPVKP